MKTCLLVLLVLIVGKLGFSFTLGEESSLLLSHNNTDVNEYMSNFSANVEMFSPTLFRHQGRVYNLETIMTKGDTIEVVHLLSKGSRELQTHYFLTFIAKNQLYESLKKTCLILNEESNVESDNHNNFSVIVLSGCLCFDLVKSQSLQVQSMSNGNSGFIISLRMYSIEIQLDANFSQIEPQFTLIRDSDKTKLIIKSSYFIEGEELFYWSEKISTIIGIDEKLLGFAFILLGILLTIRGEYVFLALPTTTLVVIWVVTIYQFTTPFYFPNIFLMILLAFMLTLRIIIEPVFLLTAMTFSNSVSIANILLKYIVGFWMISESYLPYLISPNSYYIFFALILVLSELYSEELQMYNVIISTLHVGVSIIHQGLLLWDKASSTLRVPHFLFEFYLYNQNLDKNVLLKHSLGIRSDKLRYLTAEIFIVMIGLCIQLYAKDYNLNAHLLGDDESDDNSHNSHDFDTAEESEGKQ